MNENSKFSIIVGGIFSLGGFLLSGCADSERDAVSSGAIKVEIVASDNGHQLIRGGQAYLVKGAGLDFGDMDSLVAHGGNSIRTWSTNSDSRTAKELLDEAQQKGVTVSLCLQLGAEHWGFDYDDPEAVAAQLEYARSEVLKFRDHPALLTWIIGNELNLNYSNPKVYDAVNDISQMIHELDPNHPTTTTVAGLNSDVIREIEARAPDLDFVSFQVYGELANLPTFVRERPYERPFFITEWGAIGYWEVDKTEWGAPIEATSSGKAATYLSGYQDKLAPLAGSVIGSYVFLWGQKQERTPTWFGVFTELGEETEAIDVMHYIWNESWPENRSPSVVAFTLDGRTADDSVRLRAGNSYTAVAEFFDHEDDSLTYRWELKPESDAKQVGGKFEDAIENLELPTNGSPGNTLEIETPATPGAFRLFVYANDGHGNAAHANIPFYVDP